ncbi:unnamed protein product [Rhizoctonia solani]|uniref:Uncharacterized protein n=1 Tax=Rhizoctonia solani TaxID=456999 RepID=A0A8H3DI20_9AGAM|nr:unnamed protein product [Rhizoctonia solani]
MAGGGVRGKVSGVLLPSKPPVDKPPTPEIQSDEAIEFLSDKTMETPNDESMQASSEATMAEPTRGTSEEPLEIVFREAIPQGEKDLNNVKARIFAWNACHQRQWAFETDDGGLLTEEKYN